MIKASQLELMAILEERLIWENSHLDRWKDDLFQLDPARPLLLSKPDAVIPTKISDEPSSYLVKQLEFDFSENAVVPEY